MKVILLETVEHLGNVGDVVEVKPGFARNYLFPRGMAVLATPKGMEAIQTKIEALKKQEEEVKAKLATEAKSLEKIVLTFPVKVGEEDKLFGSVTASDIADKLSESLGREIEKGELELPEPIRALGEYKIPVKLGHGIHAEITVSVIKEGTEAETKKRSTSKPRRPTSD